MCFIIFCELRFKNFRIESSFTRRNIFSLVRPILRTTALTAMSLPVSNCPTLRPAAMSLTFSNFEDDAISLTLSNIEDYRKLTLSNIEDRFYHVRAELFATVLTLPLVLFIDDVAFATTGASQRTQVGSQFCGVLTTHARTVEVLALLQDVLP